MPYTGVEKSGQDWPVANKQFDPTRGIQLYRDYIDNKVYAEECGFDWIGCNEHHMSPYGLMPNPNLIAAAVVERTQKAGILQSGNIVPLTNPLRVAEEYAMLDVQSGGRLIAGFMRGIPHEYVAYNVSPDESYGRMREACQLILKAWTEPEPFGWEGEFYKFRAVSIWPRPVQQPHPKLVMSGTSAESATLAAELGATMGLLRLTDFDAAREMMEVYRGVARANGWEPGPEHFMVGMNCCIADTDEEAIEILRSGQKYFLEVLGGGIRTAQRIVLQKTRYYESEESAKNFPGIPGRVRENALEERIEKGLVLCGTPDTVVDQITRVKAELGHGFMNLSIKVGNIPDAAVIRTMDHLRDHVFPAVRDV